MSEGPLISRGWSGGRNSERCWADRRVLITSLRDSNYTEIQTGCLTWESWNTDRTDRGILDWMQ